MTTHFHPGDLERLAAAAGRDFDGRKGFGRSVGNLAPLMLLGRATAPLQFLLHDGVFAFPQARAQVGRAGLRSMPSCSCVFPSQVVGNLRCLFSLKHGALTCHQGGALRKDFMTTLTIELPDDVYATLRRSPAEVRKEVRLAAAIDWYRQGILSQGRAAEVAGIARVDFIDALAARKIDVFQVDFDDLKIEIERD